MPAYTLPYVHGCKYPPHVSARMYPATRAWLQIPTPCERLPYVMYPPHVSALPYMMYS